MVLGSRSEGREAQDEDGGVRGRVEAQDEEAAADSHRASVARLGRRQRRVHQGEGFNHSLDHTVIIKPEKSRSDFLLNFFEFFRCHCYKNERKFIYIILRIKTDLTTIQKDLKTNFHH